MKEEKIDYDLLAAAAQSSSLTISNPGSIHLGTISAPETNEPFSISMTAQSPTLCRSNGTVQQQATVKMENNMIAEKLSLVSKEPPKTNQPNRIKEDKTKGCPYPNCSRFGRAFSRAHDLKRHIARHQQREIKTQPSQPMHHLPVPIVSCADCGSQFYSELLLEKHKAFHNTGNLILNPGAVPLSCGICKKYFEHETQLNTHLTIHLKAEQGSILSFQSQTPAPPPPLAPLSSQNSAPLPMPPEDDFRLEDMLLLRKPPSQPTLQKQIPNLSSTSNKIRCEYCSKIFKTKWTLSSHVAAHEGRFQYQCCICSKKFVRKSHYESHVRSHDAARPYCCEYCGKTFKESKHRREHLKRKHPGNRNAIQNLLDSITACVSDAGEASATAAGTAVDQSKLTLLMPMNYST